jgi:sugar lactone lactonase YvrE
MDDESAATDWGVVSTADGDLAVNATLGIAVAIAPDLTIRQTVDFEPAAASGIRLAKFGHGEAGPVGRRVIADPAGSAVFAAGAGGIVRIAPDDLAVSGRFLAGNAIDALALTPDGRTLYALLRADGRIAALDAATGEVLGWAAGEGYDRLVGVEP